MKIKGINEFLTSLLPSTIESGRIRFEDGKVESSLRRDDGQLILMSSLENSDFKEMGEVCVPHLSQLQKTCKALGEPDFSIQKTNDVATKLISKNEGSTISLFLMDPDYVSWPSLAKEPEYVMTIDLPLSTLQSLKTNYSLVSGVTTRIEADGTKLHFIIGDESHEDSAKTTLDLGEEVEWDEIIIKSEFITAILDSIWDRTSVTMHVSDKGLIKVTATTEFDDVKLKTSYFLVATQTNG